MPPKGRKRAYHMPDPLPEGEVLKDMRKKEWKLGSALGSGGFGLIYRAAENTSGSVGSDAPCVVKIEPYENGPLFTELSFYQRAAQPEKVDGWRNKQKLSYLGIPKLLGCGVHLKGKVKYRFLVMKRFGDDIWKKYLACNKKFPTTTTFALALQILDALEYLHDNDYVHADIKSANLLLGFSKKEENKVCLVDFGLVNRYRPDGKHRDYKEEPKKGHNGTPEFTSIDAHKGVAPSRRGDIQILGYVMLQWMCTKLPWEDKLADLVYVMNQKIKYSKDIGGLLKTCFKGASYPAELQKFLDSAFKLDYDEEPNYDAFRALCKSALKREGFKEGSPFDFGSAVSQATSKTRAAKSPKVSPPKAKAKAQKRKAPSRARDRSQSTDRESAGESAPGPSGEGAAPPVAKKSRAPAKKPVRKNAASDKKQGKSPGPKSPPTPNEATPAKRGARSRAKKAVNGVKETAAGTSTPSRRVRKLKAKPESMATSSTQTTPGLERQAKQSKKSWLWNS